MTAEIAYLRGRIIPAADASLPLADLGVVGGLAVSEMIRTFGHRLFELDAHLARFEQSLATLGIQCSEGPDDWRKVASELVAHNAGLLGPNAELGLILFATVGLNPTYLGRDVAQAAGPTTGAHTFVLPFKQWAAGYRDGISLVTPAVRSLPADVVPPNIKTRSRLHWYLADKSAKAIDPKALALLLNHAGEITETATGNICAVFGQRIVSPPDQQVLPGISLRVACELASELGYTIERRPLRPEDLGNADECWMTSTPHCMLPVVRLNGQPIGAGAISDGYRRCLAAWSKRVGVDIAQQMLSLL